jgi:arylsulfate sulfotransferase
VSMRHQNAVVKFSRSTGQLKWILGPHEGWGPAWQPYLLTPVGGPLEWQYAQHAPIITSTGTLVLFDDGNNRAMPFNPRLPDTNNYSRAVEYKINEETMEISQLWEYGKTNARQRLYVDHEGNAEPEPKTGNVLIAFSAVSYVDGVPPSSFGASATMTRIQEVTHEEMPEVVFDVAITMYDKSNSTYKNCSIYRCNRIPDLYGHPSMAVTDLDVEMRDNYAYLKFSGDPARTYNIETSSDLKNWTDLGAAEMTEDGISDFEDTDSGDSSNRFYRVVTH